jgi:hypothetical protein
MATYYVRPDGNNANTGTGPATNQAWQTLTKALGATGIASGDTVYIAPGSYNESVTIGMTSATATTSVIGDPTASQFTGITAGPVLWTVYTAVGATPTLTSIIATSKNYLSFQNIIFDGGTVAFTTSTNISFTNCQFTSTNLSSYMLTLTSPASTALAATLSKCSFIGGSGGPRFVGQNVADTSSVTDCLFLANTGSGFTHVNCQTTFFNNTFFCCENAGIDSQGGNASFKSNASNCLFYNGGYAIYADTSNVFTQTYNRMISNSVNLNNVPTSVTTTTTFSHGLILPYHLQNGLGTFQMFSSILGGPNTAAGIATGAPASDMYGVTWTGATPDTGSATYRNLSNVSPYVPTERNASTITIAPGSTSQSIELYLGATGLTASTSGLSARYNRTRTASVSIPLVARTIAQAWTSGGFAEVDATNMPGVYRLDLPDAALAAGADDVTVVVRGASGTNGAVMTVKLSSGGLTSAQTASAVWGASPGPYNDATTFGGVVNETAALANGIDTNVTQTPILVWDELRSSHTTAGTFGQYVNAELVTPVTSAALVRMGPYEVKADGLGASDPLDIQKGAQHGVDIQCVDGNGNGIDITSATVTAKVYNSGGSLVDTYSCTATYAADGRATFTIDTTVTNTPGTYTATITRTTGASDTQIFGPLRIYVRDI